MDGLTAYASSSSDEEDNEPVATTPAKRARTSPPPAVERAAAVSLPSPPLDDARARATEPTADGCIRQFAHVDGQYATHVYLPVRTDPRFDGALRRGRDALRASGGATVHAMEASAHHVSLSRTVTLSRGQIDGFTDALRLALRRCTAVRAPVSDALCPLANDTRTRHFAAVELCTGTPGHAAAMGMIDAVDEVLARYELPTFYAERRLHFSVAWALEPFTAPLPSLELGGGGAGAGGQRAVLFDSIEVRIGERVTAIRLART